MNRTQRRAAERARRSTTRQLRPAIPVQGIGLEEVMRVLGGADSRGQCRGCGGAMSHVEDQDWALRMLAATGDVLPPDLAASPAVFTWCDRCDRGVGVFDFAGQDVRVNIGGGCSCGDCA